MTASAWKLAPFVHETCTPLSPQAMLFTQCPKRMSRPAVILSATACQQHRPRTIYEQHSKVVQPVELLILPVKFRCNEEIKQPANRAASTGMTVRVSCRLTEQTYADGLRQFCKPKQNK